MSGPLRRGGRVVDDAGRTITWSVAEGRRGRRWRWTVADRDGTCIVAHTLETDPAGSFVRLESASGTGLLTLHRESDGSVHGNRVTESGIDHLVIPTPASEVALVGSGALGAAALVAGLGPAGAASVDVIEVFDDLSVRVPACSIHRLDGGTWEVRTDLGVRRVVVDADGLPGGGESWPLDEG